jgi:hypothetical protein
MGFQPVALKHTASKRHAPHTGKSAHAPERESRAKEKRHPVEDGVFICSSLYG